MNSISDYDEQIEFYRNEAEVSKAFCQTKDIELDIKNKRINELEEKMTNQKKEITRLHTDIENIKNFYWKYCRLYQEERQKNSVLENEIKLTALNYGEVDD